MSLKKPEGTSVNGIQLQPIKTPPRPKHEEPEQKIYGFDEGESFDDAKFEGPPQFDGLMMPPPPLLPPPANTYPYPPNAETYARAQALRWAQRILLDEFGEAKGASDGEDGERSDSGGDEGDNTKDIKSSSMSTAKVTTTGEKKDVYLCSPNWYERVEHIYVKFTLYINGKETVHECDWCTPNPEAVIKMLKNEPLAAFQSPALGMYHSEVRTIGHKAEDAALTAAIEYAAEWAMNHDGTHDGTVLDPFRDVGNIQFTFQLVTKKGKRKTVKRRHEGGPDDRMNAFKAAICRVRGW